MYMPPHYRAEILIYFCSIPLYRAVPIVIRILSSLSINTSYQSKRRNYYYQKVCPSCHRSDAAKCGDPKKG